MGSYMKIPYLLNIAPNVASAFFGLSVFISVVYEYAFFKTFGISLSQLPSSITDHLKASIDIYFFSVIISMGIFAFYLVTQHFFEATSLASAEHAELGVDKYVLLSYVGSCFFSLFCMFYFVGENPADALFQFSFSVSLFILVFLFFNRSLRASFGFLGALKIFSAILFFSSVYNFGVYKSLLIKTGSGSQVIYGNININSNYMMVKTFSSHYVFWDLNSKQLVYEKVGEVDSLRIFEK